MASRVSEGFERSQLQFTETQICEIKNLAQKEFENKPDNNIVKLSRRVFRELSHSIYAVNNYTGNISYHAQLHGSEKPRLDVPKRECSRERSNRTKKGYIGNGVKKIVYLLPDIEDSTGINDKVRIVHWSGLRYLDKRLKEFIQFVNSLEPEERELIAFDGYVEVPSEIKPGTVKDVVYIASKADVEWGSINNEFTSKQKITIVEQLLKAVNVLHSHDWSHNELNERNIMVKWITEEHFKVVLVDLDTCTSVKSFQDPEWNVSLEWLRNQNTLDDKLRVIGRIVNLFDEELTPLTGLTKKEMDKCKNAGDLLKLLTAVSTTTHFC